MGTCLCGVATISAWWSRLRTLQERDWPHVWLCSAPLLRTGRARGAGKALTAQLAKDWNLTAASQPGKNSPTLSLGLPCSMLLSATCSVNTPSVPEVINIIHLTQQLWLISQWWQRPPYSLQAHRKRGSDEARLTSKNCLGQCKHWPHYLEISLLSQLICKRVHPSLHCQAQNVITGHRGMNVSGKE